MISLIGADENGGHLSPRTFIGPVAKSLLLYVLLSLNCLKRGDRRQDWWLSLAGAVKERKRKGKYGGGEAERLSCGGTIFTREHNFEAGQLNKKTGFHRGNPGLGAEKMLQEEMDGGL